MRSRNEKRAKKKRLSQAPPTPSILVPPTYTTTQCGKPNSFSFFFANISHHGGCAPCLWAPSCVLCVWGLRVSECAPTEVARWLSYAATLHRECLTFSLLFPPPRSFIPCGAFFFSPTQHGTATTTKKIIICHVSAHIDKLFKSLLLHCFGASSKITFEYIATKLI
ncbi:Hypothetical protein, putative [Bodo saltans]|uniref:Uncharacterized protein n=1 Tax=Bodo saltans TaxID=75058 RepID=A0A0S4IZ85_BODSA|nr:Hypothetical protein, putative [Bodo saltans]|eukprot:CUG04797.1 Hypothetical protein, putative [Bodo saltans]